MPLGFSHLTKERKTFNFKKKKKERKLRKDFFFQVANKQTNKKMLSIQKIINE